MFIIPFHWYVYMYVISLEIRYIQHKQVYWSVDCAVFYILELLFTLCQQNFCLGALVLYALYSILNALGVHHYIIYILYNFNLYFFHQHHLHHIFLIVLYVFMSYFYLCLCEILLVMFLYV